MSPESSKKEKFSFQNKIIDAQKATSISAFNSFPVDVKFTGQDSDEKIILVVRQHWAIFIPFFIKIVIALALPSLVLGLLDYMGTVVKPEDSMFVSGVIFLWILILVTYSITTFFRWFYTVNIITSQRIVDIDFNNIFYHKFSECAIDKIEDVSHVPAGMWATVFDFGTVHVQTAAEQREFEFKNVPRPRDIQDTLNDLFKMSGKRRR